MKNQILRGKILKLLHKMFPDGIDNTSLLGVYYQYEKIDDIEKAVEYLVCKNLVVKKSTPHPINEHKTLVYYKISAEGIDLVEGSISPETGIVIPQE